MNAEEGDSATMIPSNTQETVLCTPKKTKKHRSKFVRNPQMKQNKKSGITYDLYANAVASEAVTLNPSESDAIMHLIKTQGKAHNISKASLESAQQKSHKESVTHHEEAATATWALESGKRRTDGSCRRTRI